MSFDASQGKRPSLRLSRFTLTISLCLILLVLAVGGFAQGSSNPTIYALTADGQLISFNAATPGTLNNSVALTGVPAGETILGIDVRPLNGQLFAVSSAGRLYTINPTTGGVTGIGSAFSTPLSGTSFGFDFNPTVDRIRLTSNTGQNLRLNPNNGAVAAVDGVLAYGLADANAGTQPNVISSGYTNNFGTATTTVLYNIDSSLDLFLVQNPPNNGTLGTVGALGVDVSSNASLDIFSDAVGSDVAYLADGSSLYTVSIATGRATFVGSIGASVTSIAIVGSTSMAMNVPACADFNGSTNPIVRVGFNGDSAFCRVLYENRNPMSTAAPSQVGSQAVINNGIIQAVDVFKTSGSTALTGGAQVCLLGTGNLVYLDASQSPRVPQLLTSTVNNGYTCGNIPNTGIVALTAR